MAANSQMQIVGTDFDQIKNNLLTFLQDQQILQDASYTGSVLSVLLDILAYNTHYNAFYTNMVGNEMFLDTSTRRSSVISHSKLLGYTPTSSSCSTAIVGIDVLGLDANIRTFVLPKYTKFLSDKVDGTNYTFVTTREYFVENTGDIFTINGITIKQGEPITYKYTYHNSTNKETKFKIPNSNIDLDTLEVVVQKSGTDLRLNAFHKYDGTLDIGPDSPVYFVQETLDGNYEIYFGNGIIGKKLDEGNVIIVSYLVTDGSDANGLGEFALLDTPIASYTALIVRTIQTSFVGSEKESIDSIKYMAPKVYSSQGRAVTKNDYITLLKKNKNKFPIDIVNVWSGDENDPPIYGKVFVAIKPISGYTLSENQKRIIKEDIIKPFSMVTVEPDIVDVDYTFLQVEADVLIDRSKTLLSDSELRSLIKQDIQNNAANTLNSFESTLIIPNFVYSINSLDSSIITNQQRIYLQKRLLPELNIEKTYTAEFDTPIKRDVFGKSVSMSPSIQYIDNLGVTRSEVYLEQVPSSTTSLDSIQMINEGMNYTSIPDVLIVGDGTGAKAVAVVVDGKVKEITLTNPGKDYTQAIVQIIGDGILASARAVITGQYGTLRTYYYGANGIKTILNGSAGTIDYLNGTVTLTNFNPKDINNTSGVLTVNVVPDSTIIQSTKNKLLTIDRDDTFSVIVNILNK